MIPLRGLYTVLIRAQAYFKILRDGFNIKKAEFRKNSEILLIPTISQMVGYFKERKMDIVVIKNLLQNSKYF